MNIPNAISLGRLLAVPVTIWLIITGEIQGAFWVFVAAGVSDAVDGFIAKRFGRTTELGRYLDPLADKTLLVSVYITLGSQGYLPIWLVLLVVTRDLLIVGGTLLSALLSQPLSLKPARISKANTAAQIALACFVLGQVGFSLSLDLVAEVGIFVVAATTAISGANYLGAWLRRSNHVEGEASR